MIYEIVFTRSAFKEILSLPSEDAEIIVSEIEKLSHKQRPVGAIKLKGRLKAYWRIRVGDYRIIYAIEDKIRIIRILAVGHRKDIYK